MGFYEFPVRSPVKVLMIFLGIVLLGYISLNRLTISLFPDLRSPKITVVVDTEGLSPEEIERDIAESLERSLITIRHVSDLVTISRADSALATVTFDWGTDMDFALLDVKKAVGDLAQSKQVKQITTLQYDPNALPIYTMALSGIEDLDALHRLAEDVFKPALERMEGVAIAKVTGGVEKEVSIQTDENLMLHYNLTQASVEAALRASIVEGSGGYVSSGNERLLLKMVSERGDLAAIGSTVVGYSGETPVYLREIATIEIVPKDPESMVRCNGQAAVGISLYKEINANTVRVVASVETMLGELRQGLPKGVKIDTAYDQSIFLRKAVNELGYAAWEGMGLAMLVLLLFLRSLVPTVIVSLAIPLSIMATFTMMYFQHITLNLMSLGGLAMGVGMMVDDAIVVLESIFTERELGLDGRTAAIEGSRKVGAAVVASTLTTCVVFLPIVFVHGVAGLLFRDFAMTVVFSLLASMAVAQLLSPMLCARFLRTARRKRVERRPIYRSLLGVALRNRVLVLAVAVGLVAVCPRLLAGIPREFMPKTEEGQLLMRLRLPAGTRIEVTNQAVGRIERLAQQLGPAVEQIYSRVGVSDLATAQQAETIEGPHTAEIVLSLKGPRQGGLRAGQVVEALRPDLAKIPNLNVQFVVQQGSLYEILATGSAPISVEIEGEDLAQLDRGAESVRASLAGLPQLRNVTTSIQEGNPEARLHLDKAILAGLGFTVEGLVESLRSRLQGSVVATFQGAEGDLDIRLNSRETREEGIEHLRQMRFQSPLGQQATLGDLATFDFTRGHQEIVRRQQKRVVRVLADIREGKLSDVVRAVKDTLEGVVLPPGYRARLSGEEEQRVESFRQLQFAFILAAILNYMVMAATLESLIQPFTITLTLPLALIGVTAAFLITGETINLLAYIGMVVLVGIVVDNAIILLDYVGQLRRGGIETTEALLLAGQRRLRPILMTTLTTILALIPLVLGIGEGARLQRPLAVAVFGGLTSSTILTLFVIPVIYSLVDDLGRGLRRMFGRPGDRVKS